MSVFAIGDLHLAFSVPDKSMEFFGPLWANYTKRLEEAWKSAIGKDDLVLIPGDISWAKTLSEAEVDLAWIGALPGTKVLLKGNHDYWWSSLAQVAKILPPSMHLLQNNAFNWGDISVGGARLWDSDEYTYESWIEYIENPRAKKMQEQEGPEEREKIFLRELGRLEMSLKQLNSKAKRKMAMTHYPPIGPAGTSSRASRLLEKYGVEICVFGHLHSVRKSSPLMRELNGVRYFLTAADYLEFKPLKIL